MYIPGITSLLTFRAAHSHIWGCCHLKLDAANKLIGSLRGSVCIWVRLKSIYESMVAPYSFIFLTTHLSILRSQWHHVDRATNPENMSNLAVNKEWASLRLNRACCVLLSLSLRHKHSVAHSCTYTRCLFCGKEARQTGSRHSCPFQSVGHKLLCSMKYPQAGRQAEYNPSVCLFITVLLGFFLALGSDLGLVLFY